MKWERLDQQGDKPLARSSHTLTVVGQKAYVLGGEHKPRTPIDSVTHCYDLRNSTWSAIDAQGSPPPPCVGHTAAAIGNSIFVFGGRTAKEVGEGSLNDLYKFDTATDTWSKPQIKGANPPARSFHAMSTDGKQFLYLFGGCGSEGRLNDLWAYDAIQSKWHQLESSSEIKPRGGAGLTVTERGELFVIAGFNGQELDDCHKLDLSSLQWSNDICSVGQSKLPARSVFGIGATDQSHGSEAQLIVYGGEVDPSTQGHDGAGGYSSEVFCCSKKDGEYVWQKQAVEGTAPIARGWFAASPAKGCLLVHGGNAESNERLSDLYLLHSCHQRSCIA